MAQVFLQVLDGKDLWNPEMFKNKPIGMLNHRVHWVSVCTYNHGSRHPFKKVDLVRVNVIVFLSFFISAGSPNQWRDMSSDPQSSGTSSFQYYGTSSFQSCLWLKRIVRSCFISVLLTRRTSLMFYWPDSRFSTCSSTQRSSFAFSPRLTWGNRFEIRTEGSFFRIKE